MNSYQSMTQNNNDLHSPSERNHPFKQQNVQTHHNNNYTNEIMNENKYQPSYENQENPQLLGQSQLDHINRQMNVLQGDILDNNRQIRLLNNKITKSDFEHGQLKKLYEKQQKLKEKQTEFEQTLRNNQFLKQQRINQKLKDTHLKQSLGNQYKQIVEQRKRKQNQQKYREKQQQSAVMYYNQQAFISEQSRKKQLLDEQKRQAMEELRQREYARELDKQQKNKQKLEYNNKLNYRNKLQTQKDNVYRQYYNHFMEQQDKLQNIYKNRAMVQDTNKQMHRQQQQKKQYETFQMRMARQNEDKLRKISYERESLKSFLQAQIQQNARKKAKGRQQEHRFQGQYKSFQMSQNDYENIQRQTRKQEQRRYDNELSAQIMIKNQGDSLISQAAKRNSSLGHTQRYEGQDMERKTHNPVTNPIDFKIGITNPYVIKEYENTKEKYMGDHNLKLRNLAMIGNNSLINGHR